MPKRMAKNVLLNAREGWVGDLLAEGYELVVFLHVGDHSEQLHKWRNGFVRESVAPR